MTRTTADCCYIFNIIIIPPIPYGSMVGIYSSLLCVCLYGYRFCGTKKRSWRETRVLFLLLSGMSFWRFGELWPRGGSPWSLYTNCTWEKKFAVRLGGQSELGTVWWDMRLACKCTCC